MLQLMLLKVRKCNMSEKKEVTFECVLERLEEIIDLLESGDAPLDDSLVLFQEGVKLVKICNEKLEQAETAVSQLINVDGEFVEKSFTNGDINEN